MGGAVPAMKNIMLSPANISSMNYQTETEKILDTVKKTGMADITPDWNVYTKEYIEQGKIKNLKDKDPFTLNRMITMKDGTKCPFVILPADLSGAFDIWKFPTEKMARFQIFSILFMGSQILLMISEFVIEKMSVYISEGTAANRSGVSQAR